MGPGLEIMVWRHANSWSVQGLQNVHKEARSGGVTQESWRVASRSDGTVTTPVVNESMDTPFLKSFMRIHRISVYSIPAPR
jgi:hypothetical protein